MDNDKILKGVGIYGIIIGILGILNGISIILFKLPGYFGPISFKEVLMILFSIIIIISSIYIQKYNIWARNILGPFYILATIFLILLLIDYLGITMPLQKMIIFITLSIIAILLNICCTYILLFEKNIQKLFFEKNNITKR